MYVILDNNKNYWEYLILTSLKCILDIQFAIQNYHQSEYWSISRLLIVFTDIKKVHIIVISIYSALLSESKITHNIKNEVKINIK